MAPQHPQRQLRPRRFLLHVLGLISCAINFRYLFFLSNKISNSFGGHFQYFTNINLLLTTITFALGLYAGITNSSTVNMAENFLLSFITPLQLVLAILYWAIVLYDASLIRNSRASGPPPLFIDMGFHLFPALFLLIESIFIAQPSSLKKRQACAVIITILASYCVWCWCCFKVNGYWVYPIIGKLGLLNRAGVFFDWVVLNWGFWVGIESLKRRVQEERKVEGKKRK